MSTLHLHIIPTFESLLCFFDNKSEIFSLNTLGSLQEEIDLKVVDCENFLVKCYPINKQGKQNNIAYTADFYFENEKIYCNSKQVNVYNLPQNHVIVKMNALKMAGGMFEDFDKVETSENKIKTLKILPTLSKKGSVEVFEIKGNKPVLVENYYVNLADEKHSLNSEAIKLLEFFENLKFGDAKNLKENFSSTLSDRLTENTIEEFFGKFDEARLVNYYGDPAVVLLYEDKHEAKVFSATFDRLLIDNIFEIE